MFKQVQKIINEALIAIDQITDQLQLEAIRVSLLGKKGSITELFKDLSKLSISDKAKFGELLNYGKLQIQENILNRKKSLLEQAVNLKLSQDYIDVTLPGIGMECGNLHPVTHTLALTCKLFEQLGFDILEGPEVEDEYHNFEALNIPNHHPARAMHDTFYFLDGKLLRTHTSTIQIRAMQRINPPHKLIAIGKVYRCDSDLTHTPMFHQIEGLLVDRNINFSNLMHTLSEFLKAFFNIEDLAVRFRPSYFPFTEPSSEVDMQCVGCNGSGCKICKHTGWLEILGCGMVHPEVLKNCNVDSDIYTGWAFGIGADRLAMLRYGINDLRLMFENDLRFLKQF